MKFKVGDKVRFVNYEGAARREKEELNKEAIIIEDGSNMPLGHYQYAIESNDFHWNAVMESNLELV